MYQLVHLLLSRLIGHDNIHTRHTESSPFHRQDFTKKQEITIFCLQGITSIFQPILTSSQPSWIFCDLNKASTCHDIWRKRCFVSSSHCRQFIYSFHWIFPWMVKLLRSSFNLSSIKDIHQIAWLINVTENRRGHQEWTIQWSWQHWVH